MRTEQQDRGQQTPSKRTPLLSRCRSGLLSKKTFISLGHKLGFRSGELVQLSFFMRILLCQGRIPSFLVRSERAARLQARESILIQQARIRHLPFSFFGQLLFFHQHLINVLYPIMIERLEVSFKSIYMLLPVSYQRCLFLRYALIHSGSTPNDWQTKADLVDLNDLALIRESKTNWNLPFSISIRALPSFFTRTNVLRCP